MLLTASVSAFLRILFSGLRRVENIFISARCILSGITGTPSASVTFGAVVDINGIPAVYKFQKFIIQFHHVFHFRILIQARDLTVSANNPISPV